MLRRSLLLTLLFGLIAACSQWSTVSPATSRTSAPATAPQQAAIASAHPLATQAGKRILEAGGNAFDAAITVAAVLGVVEPYSAGLGGGGFWLLHEAANNQTVFLDAREKAPLAAHQDLYLDDNGNIIPRSSLDGPLAAAIPGQPAALDHLAKHYGRLPLEQTLTPAIRYAREGFTVDRAYIRRAKYRQAVLNRFPSARTQFLLHGEVPKPETRVRQPNLAHTLEAIARQGRDGFYRGPIAARLVEGVREAGGIWSLADLRQYQVVEREPVRFNYRGHTIISAPPPSSGGIALAQMLNMLEPYDLYRLDGISRTHVMTEAMRRAYRDRAEYLGDSDFVAVPVERLISKAYARAQAASIDLQQATPSADLKAVTTEPEGQHTTHFSILDREGNRVAATLSINLPFGSGFVPPGTGVILNNEMDDFSAKPGTPNAYGLIGSHANSIAPGKRPLSSMSPTFVESADHIAILGTPGGSRIITMVLLGILEQQRGSSPEQWVSRPRFHHQYLPDVIQHEPDTFTAAEKQALRALGHTLRDVERRYGNMQAIQWNRVHNVTRAASDPRGVGSAWVSD